MSTLTKAERDKLPEGDFGEPSMRLLPCLDQADLDTATKLLGRVKDPGAVKKRLAAIAKRKNLKLPDAWTAEFAAEEQLTKDYALITFDLGDSAQNAIVDGHVIRPAPILFRADDYPDKQFSMSPEELSLAVEEGSGPVPIKLEHRDTVLDGKLGSFSMDSLSEDLAVVGGKAKLPAWLDKVLGKGPIPLSASWHRPTKRLKEVSLVLNPRVSDAALMAAFAEAEKPPPDEGKKFTAHGRAALQHIHDVTAERGAHCQDAGKEAAAYSDENSATFTLPAERKHIQAAHDAAVKGGATCRVFSEKGNANMADDAATVALRKELEDERKKRADAEQKRTEAERRSIEAEANAAFAAESAADRTIPANRDREVAEYLQAALDDAASPAVTFGVGKTRVQAVKERWAGRPKLNLRKEQVSGRDVVVLSNDSGGESEEDKARKQAEAYAERENKKLTNGRR